MIARTTRLVVLTLAMSAVLDVSGARAQEEPDTKQTVQKARERAEKALDTAEEKTEQAIEKVKDAKRKVVEVTAETKQAAERAADQAADKAERAAEKVGELKAEAEAAAEKAKAEAEVAAQEAKGTIQVMRAKAHEIMRDAVGPTSESARRNAIRRNAWRELAKNVERPEQLPPNVREELRRHAQRVARLRRIRALASQRKEAALVERSDALIAREEARHQRKLDTFWAARSEPGEGKPSSHTPDDDQDPPDEAAEEEEEQQP